MSHPPQYFLHTPSHNSSEPQHINVTPPATANATHSDTSAYSPRVHVLSRQHAGSTPIEQHRPQTAALYNKPATHYKANQQAQKPRVRSAAGTRSHTSHSYRDDDDETKQQPQQPMSPQSPPTALTWSVASFQKLFPLLDFSTIQQAMISVVPNFVSISQMTTGGVAGGVRTEPGSAGGGSQPSHEQVQLTMKKLSELSRKRMSYIQHRQIIEERQTERRYKIFYERPPSKSEKLMFFKTGGEVPIPPAPASTILMPQIRGAHHQQHAARSQGSTHHSPSASYSQQQQQPQQSGEKKRESFLQKQSNLAPLAVGRAGAAAGQAGNNSAKGTPSASPVITPASFALTPGRPSTAALNTPAASVSASYFSLDYLLPVPPRNPVSDWIATTAQAQSGYEDERDEKDATGSLNSTGNFERAQSPFSPSRPVAAMESPRFNRHAKLVALSPEAVASPRFHDMDSPSPMPPSGTTTDPLAQTTSSLNSTGSGIVPAIPPIDPAVAGLTPKQVNVLLRFLQSSDCPFFHGSLSASTLPLVLSSADINEMARFVLAHQYAATTDKSEMLLGTMDDLISVNDSRGGRIYHSWSSLLQSLRCIFQLGKEKYIATLEKLTVFFCEDQAFARETSLLLRKEEVVHVLEIGVVSGLHSPPHLLSVLSSFIPVSAIHHSFSPSSNASQPVAGQRRFSSLSELIVAIQANLQITAAARLEIFTTPASIAHSTNPSDVELHRRLQHILDLFILHSSTLKSSIDRLAGARKRRQLAAVLAAEISEMEKNANQEAKQQTPTLSAVSAAAGAPTTPRDTPIKSRSNSSSNPTAGSTNSPTMRVLSARGGMQHHRHPSSASKNGVVDTLATSSLNELFLVLLASLHTSPSTASSVLQHMSSLDAMLAVSTSHSCGLLDITDSAIRNFTSRLYAECRMERQNMEGDVWTVLEKQAALNTTAASAAASAIFSPSSTTSSTGSTSGTPSAAATAAALVNVEGIRALQYEILSMLDPATSSIWNGSPLDRKQLKQLLRSIPSASGGVKLLLYILTRPGLSLDEPKKGVPQPVSSFKVLIKSIKKHAALIANEAKKIHAFFFDVKSPSARENYDTLFPFIPPSDLRQQHGCVELDNFAPSYSMSDCIELIIAANCSDPRQTIEHLHSLTLFGRSALLNFVDDATVGANPPQPGNVDDGSEVILHIAMAVRALNQALSARSKGCGDLQVLTNDVVTYFAQQAAAGLFAPISAISGDENGGNSAQNNVVDASVVQSWLESLHKLFNLHRDLPAMPIHSGSSLLLILHHFISSNQRFEGVSDLTKNIFEIAQQKGSANKDASQLLYSLASRYSAGGTPSPLLHALQTHPSTVRKICEEGFAGVHTVRSIEKLQSIAEKALEATSAARMAAQNDVSGDLHNGEKFPSKRSHRLATATAHVVSGGETDTLPTESGVEEFEGFPICTWQSVEEVIHCLQACERRFEKLRCAASGAEERQHLESTPAPLPPFISLLETHVNVSSWSRAEFIVTLSNMHPVSHPFLTANVAAHLSIDELEALWEKLYHCLSIPEMARLPALLWECATNIQSTVPTLAATAKTFAAKSSSHGKNRKQASHHNSMVSHPDDRKLPSLEVLCTALLAVRNAEVRGEIARVEAVETFHSGHLDQLPYSLTSPQFTSLLSSVEQYLLSHTGSLFTEEGVAAGAFNLNKKHVQQALEAIRREQASSQRAQASSSKGGKQNQTPLIPLPPLTHDEAVARMEALVEEQGMFPDWASFVEALQTFHYISPTVKQLLQSLRATANENGNNNGNGGNNNNQQNAQNNNGNGSNGNGNRSSGRNFGFARLLDAPEKSSLDVIDIEYLLHETDSVLRPLELLSLLRALDATIGPDVAPPLFDSFHHSLIPAARTILALDRAKLIEQELNRAAEQRNATEKAQQEAFKNKQQQQRSSSASSNKNINTGNANQKGKHLEDAAVSQLSAAIARASSSIFYNGHATDASYEDSDNEEEEDDEVTHMRSPSFPRDAILAILDAVGAPIQSLALPTALHFLSFLTLDYRNSYVSASGYTCADLRELECAFKALRWKKELVVRRLVQEMLEKETRERHKALLQAKMSGMTAKVAPAVEHDWMLLYSLFTVASPGFSCVSLLATLGTVLPDYSTLSSFIDGLRLLHSQSSDELHEPELLRVWELLSNDEAGAGLIDPSRFEASLLSLRGLWRTGVVERDPYGADSVHEIESRLVEMVPLAPRGKNDRNGYPTLAGLLHDFRTRFYEVPHRLVLTTLELLSDEECMLWKWNTDARARRLTGQPEFPTPAQPIVLHYLTLVPHVVRIGRKISACLERALHEGVSFLSLHELFAYLKSVDLTSAPSDGGWRAKLLESADPSYSAAASPNVDDVRAAQEDYERKVETIRHTFENEKVKLLEDLSHRQQEMDESIRASRAEQAERFQQLQSNQRLAAQRVQEAHEEEIRSIREQEAQEAQKKVKALEEQVHLLQKLLFEQKKSTSTAGTPVVNRSPRLGSAANLHLSPPAPGSGTSSAAGTSPPGPQTVNAQIVQMHRSVQSMPMFPPYVALNSNEAGDSPKPASEKSSNLSPATHSPATNPATPQKIPSGSPASAASALRPPSATRLQPSSSSAPPQASGPLPDASGAAAESTGTSSGNTPPGYTSRARSPVAAPLSFISLENSVDAPHHQRRDSMQHLRTPSETASFRAEAIDAARQQLQQRAPSPQQQPQVEAKAQELQPGETPQLHQQGEQKHHEFPVTPQPAAATEVQPSVPVSN